MLKKRITQKMQSDRIMKDKYFQGYLDYTFWTTNSKNDIREKLLKYLSKSSSDKIQCVIERINKTHDIININVRKMEIFNGK